VPVRGEIPSRRDSVRRRDSFKARLASRARFRSRRDSFEARFFEGEIGLKARFLFLQGLKPLFRNWIQTGLLSEPSTVSPCCSGGRGVCFLLWGEPGRLRGKWFFRANQGSRAPSRRDSFKARFLRGEIPLGEILFEGRFRSKRDSLQSKIPFEARFRSKEDSVRRKIPFEGRFPSKEDSVRSEIPFKGRFRSKRDSLQSKIPL
jgi:hypothetical protein